MAEKGQASVQTKGTLLVDSYHATHLNRFEDSALRVTDPRLLSQAKATNMAAGLGYGKHHKDHYLYFSYKQPGNKNADNLSGTNKPQRAPSKDPEEIWKRWRDDAKAALDEPLDLASKRDIPALKPSQRSTTEKMIDHRFMSNPQHLKRSYGAKALGYGPHDAAHHKYTAARRPADVKKVLDYSTDYTWEAYQKLLSDRNVFNQPGS